MTLEFYDYDIVCDVSHKIVEDEDYTIIDQLEN